MEFIPHSYQQYAINFALEHPKVGFFLNMGLGKTVTTLTVIDTLLWLDEVTKVLVIAPLRVAESTWSDEIDKWDHIKHLRISKILGNEKNRIEALNTDADIYIINRENVEWLVDYKFKDWDFNMLVIDELSSFKSTKAKRFRALKKVRPYFKRIIGLTGTPAPNGYMDLWPQIYLLDGGERLGKTITGYRERYFSPGRRNQHIIFEYNLKPGAEQAIFKKLSDICISIENPNINLPERVDNIISITLTDTAMKSYRALEKDLVIEMEDDDISASNSAVLTNKLMQVCNGAIYSEAKEVIEIHQEKLKALYDIIETANGKPVLVFYYFKHDADRILKFLEVKKLKGKILEGYEDIKKWNEGKIPILLLHPMSAGHGLNLQAGGNIIVWFSLTWSLEAYQQANARLHRQGQKESVIINHLVAKDTIDEDVMRALKNKDINQAILLSAVKARINE